MQPLNRINAAWVVVALTVGGLIGASCTTHKSAVFIKDGVRLRKQQAGTLTSKEPAAATKAKVQVAYGKLPLYFEANQGQSDEQVKFLSRGSGYTLFLTSTEATLALHKPTQRDTETRGHGDSFSTGTIRNPQSVALRMQLLGANPNPQVVGLDELPGKSNYFLGNDPQNWHTNIPTYARVQYQNIYPGIGLIYYGNQEQLEYDFVVAPGADPNMIRLAFEGLVGAGLCLPKKGDHKDRPYESTPTAILPSTSLTATFTYTSPASTRKSTASNTPSPAATCFLNSKLIR